MWYPWRGLVTLEFHRIQVLDGTFVGRDGGEVELIASRSFMSLPGSPRIWRFIVLLCIPTKSFRLFVIDGGGVSVRAAILQWFEGFFGGKAGTVARSCRRSHGDRTNKVDRCVSEPGDDRHSCVT